MNDNHSITDLQVGPWSFVQIVLLDAWWWCLFQQPGDCRKNLRILLNFYNTGQLI
jgi:hypothetical protein